MRLTLWQERTRRGWSLEYAARQIGVTKATLQRIETGQRKPSYDVLVKLEDLFQMNHRALFSVATLDNTKAPKTKLP
jgi:transcriptional regulator with XRE-family HTH domain